MLQLKLQTTNEKHLHLLGGLRPLQKGIVLSAALLVAAGVGAVFPRQVAESVLSVGENVDADITLLTSDSHDVQCLAETSVSKFYCSYVAQGKAWTGAEVNTIRPYMTVQGQLYLVAGLFQNAALQARVGAEPPGLPREQLNRFTAHCRLEIIGTLHNFRLRWQSNAPFGPPQATASVARVLDCTVEASQPSSP